MDQPRRPRAHPGDRHRRGRPAPVPLPRPVAGQAGRGQVRPRAGGRPAPARVARAGRRRPGRPRLRPRPGAGRSRPAAGRRGVPGRRRGLRRRGRPVRRGHLRAGHPAARACRGARAGDDLRLSGQGWRAPLAADRRRADGRRGARLLKRDADDPELLALPGRPAVARRAQRRHQRLPQGAQRRLRDQRQGLPHLARHRAGGRGTGRRTGARRRAAVGGPSGPP